MYAWASFRYVLLYRLKSDLKKKETDLLGAQRELKNLQNKFEQQQQIEADLSRKANKSVCKYLSIEYISVFSSCKTFA